MMAENINKKINFKVDTKELQKTETSLKKINKEIIAINNQIDRTKSGANTGVTIKELNAQKKLLTEQKKELKERQELLLAEKKYQEEILALLKKQGPLTAGEQNKINEFVKKLGEREKHEKAVNKQIDERIQKAAREAGVESLYLRKNTDAWKKFQAAAKKAKEDVGTTAKLDAEKLAEQRESRDFWREGVFKPGALRERFNPLNITGRKADKVIEESDKQIDKNIKEITDNKTQIAELTAKKEAAGGFLDENDTAKLAELEDKNLALATENEGLEEISGKAAATSGAVNAVKALGKTAVAIAKSINNAFKTTLGFSLSIKDTFNDVLGEIGKMLDKNTGMATYDTSSSLVTNAAARETQMRYGLSSGQNYAMTQTMGMLGMQNEEDLMYMNPSQQAVFTQFMGTYSAWYNKLSSSGVLEDIQKMQLEFSMFKQEIAVELLSWIAENKDTIMTALVVVMNATKWIVELVVKILSLFGVDTSDSTYGSYGPGITTASDTLNNVNNLGNTNTVKIDMNANATGVLSSQSQMEAFFKEQMERVVAETIIAME